ncbi:AAA family ATPase [Pseudomonas gingeri]|uniref:AAA family ATPase n=1 Tax=Pseudomonas gingeri TaxID=117681 RepID=UPI0015A31381|nr:ATP-binding protein [Pseudomonas gingeri]NWD04116.1 ATP-binding protein [Pseudomonas gingeri]NWE33914.1 ATP-binding protein [Pseudomonas gingeri]NWE58000.1 ATP-binding protein [Pseudomonas gingeri]NWF04359.1 ATP-binding protein [Pseudomonas gingeri]
MHYFINFKNYSTAQIDLFSSFTLLIGKNGSGKSNLIEGVELLAALAEGRPLHEMVEGKNQNSNGYSVRGGIHSCVKFGEKSFSLGFSGYFKFGGTNQKFDYRITVSINPYPVVIGEYLILGTRKIFFAESAPTARDGLLSVQFDNFARGGTKPQKKLYGDRSIISRYEELVDGNESGDKNKKLKAIQMVASIRRHLQSSFVFDPNPKLMRDYTRVGQNVLLKDGSNISAVLYSMQSSEGEPSTLENVLSVVRQLPEEPFLEFDFVTTSQHDVLLAINSGSNAIDARLISDGTLRAMAVITALESINNGSRVVIEEFDNGLHPSRAAILIEAIGEIVARKKLNILLSTHNPASLNSLTTEWLEKVHVCHWDSESQSSKLVKLLDIPDVDSLLESNGGLGDLVTRSVFEKHLSPKFPESKKKIAKDWLERLGS